MAATNTKRSLKGGWHWHLWTECTGERGLYRNFDEYVYCLRAHRQSKRGWDALGGKRPTLCLSEYWMESTSCRAAMLYGIHLIFWSGIYPPIPLTLASRIPARMSCALRRVLQMMRGSPVLAAAGFCGALSGHVAGATLREFDSGYYCVEGHNGRKTNSNGSELFCHKRGRLLCSKPICCWRRFQRDKNK